MDDPRAAAHRAHASASQALSALASAFVSETPPQAKRRVKSKRLDALAAYRAAVPADAERALQVEPVGSGGFGTTAFIVDATSGARIAVAKTVRLRGDASTDAIIVDEMRAERDLYAYLASLGVDRGRDAVVPRFLGPPARVDSDALVLAYAPSRTLTDWWDAEIGPPSRTPPRRRVLRALSAMIPTFRKLADLHAAGIAHGDVHPDNVLVVDSGGLDVRIIDLGHAGADAVDPARLAELRSRTPGLQLPTPPLPAGVPACTVRRTCRQRYRTTAPESVGFTREDEDAEARGLGFAADVYATCGVFVDLLVRGGLRTLYGLPRGAGGAHELLADALEDEVRERYTERRGGVRFRNWSRLWDAVFERRAVDGRPGQGRVVGRSRWWREANADVRDCVELLLPGLHFIEHERAPAAAIAGALLLYWVALREGPAEDQ
jgi:hypothetical protein